MRKQSGQTLVATLIVLAIIGILAVVYLGGSGKSNRKDGLGTTLPGKVRLAAQDDVCRSNLGQMRAGIQLAQGNSGDDTLPQTLEETKLGSDFYKCPIGKEKYTYDPTTGEVKCPHPGHEKY